MRTPVNRIEVFAAALLVACAAGGVARPAAAKQEGEDRFVPGLAVVSGVTFQKQDATVESRVVSTGLPLRPAESGSDWAVSPYVGATLELMSPAIPVPGRPRVFLGGGILPTFASDLDIAKEGDPTSLKPPPLVDPGQFPVGAITGLGSRTSAEIQTVVWGANVGVAFPFELRGRQLRVKPSAGWIRYRIHVDGFVLSAAKDDCCPTSMADQFGRNIREISLSGNDSLTLDGIGPGLELEMDAFRWGPLGASLFLDGGAYRILGERSVRFSDTQSYPQLGGLPPETYTADWSFEADPWIFRAGVGLRLHWLGR
jgi:hypothetical protein